MRLLDLGLIDYNKAWDLQKETFESVKTRVLPQTVILCQHYPVITLGRAADRNNVLVDGRRLEAKEIRVYEIERGGDVTYHGPGQLTVYPILDLRNFKRDIHLFLRYLEEMVMELLRDLGINGVRYPGLTGVWIGKRKVASIGISIRNWISSHGLSINVKQADLDNFRLIRPCGMDVEMTSIETELNRDVAIADIKEIIIRKFRAPILVEQDNVSYS